MWLYGDALPETDERGYPLKDSSFLVLFNAHHDLIDFKLPALDEGGSWQAEIDTSSDTGDAPEAQRTPAENYPLQGRSLVVLREVSARAP
jgi:glycogen operon protein